MLFHLHKLSSTIIRFYIHFYFIFYVMFIYQNIVFALYFLLIFETKMSSIYVPFVSFSRYYHSFLQRFILFLSHSFLRFFFSSSIIFCLLNHFCLNICISRFFIFHRIFISKSYYKHQVQITGKRYYICTQLCLHFNCSITSERVHQFNEHQEEKTVNRNFSLMVLLKSTFYILFSNKFAFLLNLPRMLGLKYLGENGAKIVKGR